MMSSVTPSAKYLLLGIAAHIGEGQHRDRWLSRWHHGRDVRRIGARPLSGRAKNNAVGPHRAGDVLDQPLAHILEGEVEFVAHLIAHDAAGADATWIGQRFEAGSDVDPVAEDVAILNDDVADIDAHAEFDALFRRDAEVTCRHFALHFDRAPDRVDDAAKLDEQSIAGGLNNSATMFLDLRVAELAADRPQLGEGTFFVPAHQP
jgi:hypothetical protein